VIANTTDEAGGIWSSVDDVNDSCLVFADTVFFADDDDDDDDDNNPDNGCLVFGGPVFFADNNDDDEDDDFCLLIPNIYLRVTLNEPLFFERSR
jgi:hypothetical protein